MFSMPTLFWMHDVTKKTQAAGRPYHHGDLRRALLDTALQILREERNWDFTLRELARRAGVSHAAPYKHFADKQDLLSAVAALGFDALRRQMQAAIERHADDPVTQLAAMGEAYVVFAVDNPAHFRLMFGPDLIGEQPSPALQEAADASRQVMLETVRKSAAAGLFGSKDADVQALAAWSLVHGLAMLLIDNRLDPMPMDAHALAAAVTRAFISG